MQTGPSRKKLNDLTTSTDEFIKLCDDLNTKLILMLRNKRTLHKMLRAPVVCGSYVGCEFSFESLYHNLLAQAYFIEIRTLQYHKI